MRQFIIFALALFLSFPAMAEIIKVNISGMYCEMCVRTLERVFHKQEAVEVADADLESETLILQIKDGQTLSNEVIQNLITDGGYEATKITRSE